MKKECKYCGNTFEGRTNKNYCSVACKQAYHRDKTAKQNDKKKIDTTVSSITNTLIPQFSKSITSQAGVGIGNIISQPLNDFSKSIGIGSKNIDDTLSYRKRAATQIISCGAGALIGWYLTKDKKKMEISQRLMTVGAGAFSGMLIFNLVELLKDPYNIYNSQNQIEEAEVLNYNFIDTPPIMLSGWESKRLDLRSIEIDDGWDEWIGEKLNYKFWILVHGSPGAGKSHLATKLCAYFASKYKVLYILSEEGFTESVIKRNNTYPNTDNITFLESNKSSEILDAVNNKNFDIVCFDSLQAINISSNELMDFIGKIRNNRNVMGIVTVNQNTKAGSARGNLQIIHGAEVIIDVNVENNVNIATITKNRYGYSGQSIEIFTKEMNYNEN